MEDSCYDFGSVDLSSLVDGHYWVLVGSNYGCQQVHVSEGVCQLFGLFRCHWWFVLFVGLAIIGNEVSELVIAGAETSKESSFSWSSSNVMEVS